MEGLYINGEKCNQDTLSKCTPNKGNILLTYDTLSRTKSPETILSSSDSDIIILDNGVGEKAPPWSSSREVETNQFTRNLKGLRTPSPRAIVTQWLQASPSCKTPENTQTIVVERTVEDKEQYASRPNTPSTFEMFDLGANRRNTLTGENLSGSGLSPNPASPETRRKQELCSYLQLMNMNSKSDKQRTKLRSNFNRRSNRVKNLIVQIEKRKLEERLNKEIEINTPENAKMAQHLFCLHPNLCSQTTLSLANDIIPLRESPESGAILQGFTPSLMPTKIRMRKIAFDIVMRRFITDETITINKRKRTSMNSDEPSDITSTTSVTKRPRQKLQVTAAIGSEIKSHKPLARRGSMINFNNERSDIRRITSRTKYIRSKLIVTAPNISKKKDLKEKIAEATKEVKTPLRIVKIKTLNRKIKQKRIKKAESGIGITLFEREINKINRIGRRNKISRFHNLRILNNRLKHKENLPNKKSNSIVANILKAKQGKSSEVIEHRNNGINKDAKLKKYHKKINEIEVVSRRNEENSENRLHCQSIQKKLTEIVDLSKNSSILDKNSKEENPNLHSVKKSNTPLIVKKEENPTINILTIDQNEPSHKDSYYLMDHTYAQTTKETSIDTNQEDYKNHEVSIEQPNFYGFTIEEQCDSNNFLNLISALHSTSNNETITENITKETDLSCTLELKEDLIIEQQLVQANFDNVVLEDNNLSDKIIKTDNSNTKDLDLSNQLIHYNMHDYYAQEGLSNFSNISDNSSSSNDEDSSDSASIYSATSAKTIKQNTQLLEKSSEAYLKSPEIIKETRKEKSASSAVAFLKEMEVPVNEAITPQYLEEPTTPDITEHLEANTNTDKMIIQTEPILNFIPQSNEIRPLTPTYIPFVRQDKTPSKTLHRNLTNNNDNIRRKAALLDSPSASCQRDNISTTSLPPNQSNTNNLKHCATLAPSDGRLLHAEYCAGQLIASQERLVTCWAQTPLGHILHSQDLWIARGAVARQQFGNDSVLKHMKNRVMIIDNVVSYVEIWVKEHRSIFRERPVADVFAVLYSWKMNQTVEKKLIQLENIKGSADDVQCIILKKSRSVLVSWSMQSQLKQTTVLHLYQLSPDYQRVLTIKELKSVGTKIQSLHTIEDSDDLIIGCGENCINIWNIENGYIVATLDMPDILPEPKCLWTLCNQGFVFLLQECNDGLLRLIAINGMKMKITWKNLKIFHPPKEYYNLQGVCLENGILISCYENGILSWNVQTSELLTEEPLPTEDMAPFSSPSCFLSDSHIVQLERNGQIQVSHVSYHLLTSCDLSV